ERRRKAVAFAARSRRKVVVNRLAPGIVRPDAQRAELALQANLQGAVLAASIVVSEQHRAELRGPAQTILRKSGGRVLAEIVHVYCGRRRANLTRGEHARTNRRERGGGRTEDRSDRIVERHRAQVAQVTGNLVEGGEEAVVVNVRLIQIRLE